MTTASELIYDANALGAMVATIFASWNSMVIFTDPTISVNTILLGSAWVVITLNWIQRMRAPKVTNG